MRKECSRCSDIKELEYFHIAIRGKLGRCSICKECRKIDGLNNRLKNKDSIKEYKKTYYEKNKKEISDKKKDKKAWKLYYLNNKEKVSVANKKYRTLNKDIINEKSNYYRKCRRNDDILYRIITSIRSSIGCSLRYNGYSKKSKSYEILGCTYEEFSEYLESKFEEWMCWDNYGKYNGELNYGWDMDHIKPISSANSEEEILKLNHFTNFQPLCSKVNRDIKKNKILP